MCVCRKDVVGSFTRRDLCCSHSISVSHAIIVSKIVLAKSLFSLTSSKSCAVPTGKTVTAGNYLFSVGPKFEFLLLIK